MNVISFSLFGDKEKYNTGILKNLELARKIYPGWEIIIFHDNSTPKTVLQQIGSQAELYNVSSMNLAPMPGMLWRFCINDFRFVERFIVRDADSRISMREKKAVDEWIASGKRLHVMRDHPGHTQAIIGGMWGMVKDNSCSFIKEISAYVKDKAATSLQIEADFLSEVFLREVVYKKHKKNMLVHQSIEYQFNETNVKPFPSVIKNTRYVGEHFHADDTPEEQINIWKSHKEKRFFEKKTSMMLYPINVESAPNWVIRKAFTQAFYPFWEYDWVNIANTKGLPQTQKEFIEILKQESPEYCFMQLQNSVNMDVNMVKEMSKYTKIINWTGDVRRTEEWYQWFADIGQEIFLTLFPCEEAPEILKAKDVNADYLQVGFDNVWYNKKTPTPNAPEIVYCCNNYGKFELSDYRIEVAMALKEKYGARFKVYGSGWEKYNIATRRINNMQEADAYNSCKIAISVSNYNIPRYHSDRLLRIMGCGAFPLSHNYTGFEKDYTEGKNIAVFNDIEDLIQKCDYYLEHDKERQKIADNAYKKAHTDCTWDKRCQELIQLIKKHEAKRTN